MINNIKLLKLEKILIAVFLLTCSVAAQQLKVVSVKGDVKYQYGTSENWIELKGGEDLQTNGFVTTGKNSSVKIDKSGSKITIDELSAVSISSIKKMTTDELLLALAMEDMINAPKTNGKGNSNSTATYGEKENAEKINNPETNDFGVKRLNGAVQLADNGLKESSVIFAKETYRKYPETKQVASYRIFFADILYEKGLYEEALGEYMDIQKLELNKDQIDNIDSRINSINKILLNN